MYILGKDYEYEIQSNNNEFNIFKGILLSIFTNSFYFCSRYPFNDSEHITLFVKISRGHFVIPECLSARARCLIRSLLRREPSERLTSEDILFHPWLAKEEKDWSSRACDQLVPDCSLFDD